MLFSVLINSTFSNIVKHCAPEYLTVLRDNIELLKKLRIIEGLDDEFVLNVRLQSL